jgi:chromosome segregation ATPase
MRNKFIAAVLLGIGGFSWATEQNELLNLHIQKSDKRLESLEKNTKQNQESLAQLKKQLSEAAAESSAQKKTLSSINARLAELDGKHGSLEGSLTQLSLDTDEKTKTIDKNLTTQSQWYGASVAIILSLLGLGYWYLRRRNDASEQSLSAQVKSAIDTVRSTEEKIAKSDTALADSLFEILNKLKIQDMSAAASGQAKPAEANHHLPLKLADEIHRMRKRLDSLPEDTKGLTPLQKSLERLESELAEQGYEIVDHTGMAYTENLSVKARFVPSDDLGPDQKIISKVVVPQVNYKGVMIRMADIEVSIGS